MSGVAQTAPSSALRLSSGQARPARPAGGIGRDSLCCPSTLLRLLLGALRGVGRSKAGALP